MSPEEALRLAKTVADIYAEGTTNLLVTIAKAAARGVDRPQWANERLAETLQLRDKAQRVVADMQARGGDAATRVLQEAYSGGRLRSPLDAPGMVAVNQRSVLALAQQTTQALQAASPQILRWTDDVYRRTIAEAAAPGVVTGTLSRRMAAGRAIDRFAAIGVTGFTDRAGRKWALDTYAEMATRTAAGRAHLAGNLDRYTSSGVDLVIVSDSPEECALCREYEGKILSLSGAPPNTGDTAGFVYMGSLADAVGGGLFHPNCTHRTSAFTPGLTKPLTGTANPAGDRLRQRQRELERRVRESKRRVAAVEPFGPTPWLTRARSLLKDRSVALRDFNAAHGRKAWVSAQRTQLRSPPLPTREATPATAVTGVPVSAAITVRVTPGLRPSIETALAAIDKVHSDGALPVIEMRATRSERTLGEYTFNGAESRDIGISSAGTTPALTTVHEIGHFIDHRGLPTTSLATRDPKQAGLMGEFTRAVDNSQAVTDLYNVKPRDYGARAAELKSHVKYLLDPAELWGRAYAQYVATRSGSPQLMRELDERLVAQRANGVAEQWEHDDFVPIAAAMDGLMRRMGWRT